MLRGSGQTRLAGFLLELVSVLTNFHTQSTWLKFSQKDSVHPCHGGFHLFFVILLCEFYSVLCYFYCYQTLALPHAKHLLYQKVTSSEFQGVLFFFLNFI